MLKKLFIAVNTAFVLSLTAGCASTGAQRAALDEHIDPRFIKIELPRVVSPNEQLNLVKVSQVLGNKKLTPVQTAAVMWRRAEIYNHLGLDFLSVISLLACIGVDNQSSDCYRDYGASLYVHSKFLEAYDALDGAIELNPHDSSAYFQRGMALYYGKRELMAEKDLYQNYLKDRQDPYYMLWLFFAENANDPEKARQKLLDRYRMINAKDLVFGTRLVEVFLGFRTEEDLWEHIFDNTKDYVERNEHLCEAYFYMGKMHLLAGKKQKALDYFKLARSTNVTYFLEFENALLEIHMLDTANEYQHIGYDDKVLNPAEAEEKTEDK